MKWYNKEQVTHSNIQPLDLLSFELVYRLNINSNWKLLYVSLQDLFLPKISNTDRFFISGDLEIAKEQFKRFTALKGLGCRLFRYFLWVGRVDFLITTIFKIWLIPIYYIPNASQFCLLWPHYKTEKVYLKWSRNKLSLIFFK